MKRLKLSTKITWNYALIFTSILLIINFAVFLTSQFYNRVSARNEVDALLGALAEDLRSGVELTPEELKTRGIVPPFVAVLEQGGAVTVSQENYRLSSQGEKLTLEKDFLSGVESTTNFIYTREKVAAPEGIVTVTLLKDLSGYRFMSSVNLITLIIASLLGIVVSYVVGYYISRQSFTPILQMTKSAAAIGPTNIHDRIPEPPVMDELKELSMTFNGLLDRLDDAYSKQSKFVSDASHELRTPLTVIKGYNDLLRRWGKTDPEILEEAIGAIRAETDNMSMLVENLLFIAKGENRKLKLDLQPFSLCDLLEEVAKDFRLSVPERQYEVRCEEISVVQDRRMIKQLLRIFVDNSVKFTPAGSLISLEATPTETGYVLRVRDEGEGIAEADLQHVFERFYVADKARTKDKAGSGLGLSIARWIVETHGGTVKALSVQGQGTTMEADFAHRDFSGQSV